MRDVSPMPAADGLQSARKCRAGVATPPSLPVHLAMHSIDRSMYTTKLSWAGRLHGGGAR
jgi:hypothetical protein